VNDVARSGIGFDADRNEVTIVTPTEVIALPEASKLEIAQKILEAALRIRRQEGTPVPAPTSRADL
jgi:phosphopantothenoylcysteine decarboxylase/phosphopantothenate--cysteine ligase